MMIRFISAAMLAAVMPLAACAQEAPTRHRAEIVTEFPHDAEAFTQGLFIHDGQLFESTGRVGDSSLRRVDLETGIVEQQVDIPAPYFGEGSAQIGDEIFMLSWVAQTGFVFNAETFEQTDSFSYPGEGWGLTTDGTRLFMSDGSAILRVLDPTSMELSGEIAVTYLGRPMPRLNELEWVDGEIWANVWLTSTIVRINPETGHVTGQINLTDILPANVRGSRDAVANGIAWNAETGSIYVTGKLWPALYEIRLADLN
jgi:glutamine cyclotransferase